MRVLSRAAVAATFPTATFLVVTLLTATALVAPVAAEVYVVSPDGPTTIQAAIWQCVDGDVVELLDGIYTGDGNRDLVFDGREITVRSASGDPAACIIDCEGDEFDHHHGFHLEGPQTLASIIEGITIRNGYDSWSGGVFCRLATIRNCRFVGNVGSEGGAITMQDAGVIEDCWFEGNHAYNGGAVSVCCGYDPEATVTGCTFVGNTADNYGGAFRT
jgi:hypothetical protein